MPELRLVELDVEFEENCSIECAGIAEGIKEILLGHRLTAVGKTLFTEIKVARVTAIYRGADKDRVKPPTFKCRDKSRAEENTPPQCPQPAGYPLHRFL